MALFSGLFWSFALPLFHTVGNLLNNQTEIYTFN